MSTEEQQPAGAGLKHLDGKAFDAVLAWLERALRGREALPLVVPGESPEDSILRHERALTSLTREDLREACRVLARRFVRQPQDDDDYVAALLRLAKGFNLLEVASDLHVLASTTDSFSSLPAIQQKTVLSTLFDLRAPLATSFWQELGERDPARFGVIALSGLLRHGSRAALQLLPSLPDNDGIADAVYIVLGQHAQLLDPAERDELVSLAREAAGSSKPRIQSALTDWADEQASVTKKKAPPAHGARLHAALSARAASRREKYVPRPHSPRLVRENEKVAASR